MRRKSILYAALYPPVNWACRLFYRNLHVRNSSVVCKTDAPILLVSNHQNALMDPLLCCISSPRQLNFLTRADVFKKPWAKKILFSLNMLPVYRPHDKVNILESNAPTFEESLRRLEYKEIISLFPEGTHQKDQNIKTFKKGAARLIGNVFDAGNCDKIIVQPVGLHFTNIMHSGYPAYVHFGEQEIIKASDLDLASENRSKTVLKLTTLLQNTLTKYVVHIDEESNYQKKLFIFRTLQWDLLFSKRSHSIHEFKELEGQLDTHLHLLHEVNEAELQKLDESSFDMPALVLASNGTIRKKFARKLLFIMPIYFLGFLCTAIPYLIGKGVSNKVVKDVCFTSTAKIVLGAVLIPVFWLLLSITSLTFTPWWISSLSSVTMIFCGAIFLKYHSSYRMLFRAKKIKRNTSFQPYLTAVKNILFPG